MSSLTYRVQYTYEDYLLFPDDGKRHELIDGEHIMSPSPLTKHQRILRKLMVAFDVFLAKNKIGEVFPAPCDVIFSDTDIVEPDILFVSAERASIVTEKNVQGAPDLVVEIISPSTRKTDEVVKRKLYEQYGVGEYWVVDPELEGVKVYRRVNDRYERVAELSKEANDALSTPCLPSWTMPLSEVFE
jgi:Uma2 family endonuclease